MSKKDGCKVFIGVVLLLGGVVYIIIPAKEFYGDSISYILLGTSLIVLGSFFIWK